MNVRTRFAPSPTGYLHVGGGRSALFNWPVVALNAFQRIPYSNFTKIRRFKKYV